MPSGRRKNKEVPIDIIIKVVTNVTLVLGLNNKAKSIIVYLIRVTLDYGSAATARALKIPHPNVSYHCNLVEDLRDNPAYDKQLTELEESLL